MRIDAHQHFWWLDRCRYDWLTPAHGELHRDHEPLELRPYLERHGIDRTVLVQASDTLEETRFLLEIAAREPFVFGVVGWVPLEDPAAATHLRTFARDQNFVGVRPMLQDLPDDDWILRADVAEGLAATERLGLVFDALVRPQQLHHVVELARRWPQLAIVLDHAGKPNLAAGATWSGLAKWRRDVADLGRLDNVAVKLSGLVTQATSDWRASDFAATAQFLLEHFGPQRVLWGSDWPVCNVAGGYTRWWDATTELLEALGDAERDAVLGDNAARLYRHRSGATSTTHEQDPR